MCVCVSAPGPGALRALDFGFAPVSREQEAANKEEERRSKLELEERYRAVFGGGAEDASSDEEAPPF